LYANAWNGMMIGIGRVWQLNLVQLVISTSSLALTFLFIVLFSGGPLAAMAVFLLSSIIQVFIMALMALRLGTDRSAEEPPSDLSRQMWSFGLRSYPGSIADLLWLHTPVFLLNAFHGTAAVGIFSIAQQLVEKLLLPIQAMQDAIFKKVSVLPARAAIFAMNRYVRVTLGAMAILALTGMLLMPGVVLLLFGETYLRTAQICRLLLPGTVIMSTSLLLTVYFLGQMRRPGLLSIFGWVHALINLTLSLLLIPKLAEVGASMALLAGQIVGGVFVLTFYLRRTRTGIKQLIYINGEDVMILRQQIGTILGGKGKVDE